MTSETGRAASAVLGGGAPLGLADDFWLLAHDTVGAGLRLHARAHNCGLAACLLGELWLAGAVGIDAGLVSAVDRRPAAPADLAAQPPVPSLVERLWAQVAHEPWRHQVRTWLAVLGQDADQQVIDRLAAAGHLRVQRSRRSILVEPASRNATGIPAVRLRTYLERQHQMSAQDMVLLALLEATGLSVTVLDGVHQSVRDYHQRLLDHIGRQYPAITELAGHTRAAVASVTLLRGTG